MTNRRQLIIDLDFMSSCSEADLHNHVESIISQIRNRVETIPTESWNNRVYTDWDESYKVETNVRVTCNEIK